MRFRTWPVAALGLGGLLLLVIVSVLATSSRAQAIYTELDRLNTHHREVEANLRRLRSDVHLSGIYLRDYLLDPERSRAAQYRQKLAAFRQSNVTTVAELHALTAGAAGHHERLTSLEAKLDDYWQTFDPLFDWSPAEKIMLSAAFLRSEVLPRREAVLSIALEVEELNNANHAAQRAEVTRQQDAFRSDLDKLMWGSLFLGLVVAVTAVIRLRVLERETEDRRVDAEEAERQMRELSQQLVATQEEERKKLSRELHDHIGQMLTAIRMELGRIDRLRSPADGRLAGAVSECRQLVDNMVRTARDLALGLRPSMLDDFGLQPALEWHVRDFGRRYGVPVELMVRGEFDELPESYRTCVYRAVQEALTNVVRHARATHIDVTILEEPENEEPDNLVVSVVDNGIGFDAPALSGVEPPGLSRVEARRRIGGLGLRGIEERVRELHGTMTIKSAASVGTTLIIRLPHPAKRPVPEAIRARAAG